MFSLKMASKSRNMLL